MEFTGDVFIRVEGRVGRITLNRPQALNALNAGLAAAMSEALRQWAGDDKIALVLVDGEGERAFCAGGDLSAIYSSAVAGDYESPLHFWRIEYQLDRLIATYPKPYAVIMDGFVMGGGVGISAHGSHRIVTETSVVSMPECSIGLVTDAGGTHLLARAPGFLGEYLGLTGYRMKAADAILAGFADVYVPRNALPELKTALVETAAISTLGAFAVQPPFSSDLERRRAEIDPVFSAQTVGEILERLETVCSDWAMNAFVSIRAASPMAVLITLQAMRDARENGSLDRALRNEYRFVSRSLQHGDFREGIRAAVIDKDRKPRWRHTGIEAVPAELVALMLSPAEDGDPNFANGDD
jgi:enoyl-CoA hydratase